MPNAWQDYAALIFAFYNRSGIVPKRENPDSLTNIVIGYPFLSVSIIFPSSFYQWPIISPFPIPHQNFSITLPPQKQKKDGQKKGQNIS